MTPPCEAMNSQPFKSDAAATGRPLLHRAWQHRRLVAACTLAGALAGGLYYLRAPRVYQSAAQVMVSRKHPDVITGTDTRNGAAEDFVSTHQDLLRSQLVIERAIKQAHLAALPSFAGKTELTGAVANSLSVNRGRGAYGETNVLQLTFRAGSPDDAAVVLAALLRSYQDFLKEKYRAESNQLVQLIRQARDELAQELDRKWSTRAEYRKRHRLVEKGDGVLEVRRKQLQDLQSKRSEWVLRKAEIQAQLTALDGAKKEGRDAGALLAMASEFVRKAEPGSAGNDSGPTLQERLLPLLDEEQKLLATHGPNHPDVQAVRQQIAATRAFFSRPTAAWGAAGRADDPVEQHVRYLRQKLAQAGIAEQAFTAAYERALDEASRLDQEEMQDAKLKADYDRTQDLYDTVVKRVKAADLSQFGGGYDADVISAPAAGVKVAPAVIPTVPLTAVLGLLVGFGLAYVVSALDRRFESADEVRERLGLPVLGAVPTFAASRNGGQAEFDPILCTYTRPGSAEAESFRGLRTALYFSALGRARQVLQVTSPGKGDGKSTLAANLALSIAQSGKRVLLVDADLRAPRQHTLFGVPAAAGLSSVLGGEVDLADAIHALPVAGLSVLTAGPRPAAPAELLTSPRFGEVLTLLREHYDFVILDTPPLLGTTDASVVASRADGVLLALRLDRPGRPAAERAREVLATVGACVVGAVINHAEPSAGGRWISRFGYRAGSVQPAGAASYQGTADAAPTAPG